MSDCIKNRLVLVATAGSATTGPLELPALGADIGPKREVNQHYMNLLYYVHFGQYFQSSKSDLCSVWSVHYF